MNIYREKFNNTSILNQSNIGEICIVGEAVAQVCSFLVNGHYWYLLILIDYGTKVSLLFPLKNLEIFKIFYLSVSPVLHFLNQRNHRKVDVVNWRKKKMMKSKKHLNYLIMTKIMNLIIMNLKYKYLILLTHYNSLFL